MKVWSWALASVSVVGVTVAIASANHSVTHHDKKEDPTADLKAQVEALRSEVQNLQAKPSIVVQGGFGQQQVAPAPAASAAAKDGEHDDGENGAADMAEVARTRNAQTFADLEARFVSEPPDKVWSNTTEQAIRGALGGVSLPGTQLLETGCASTMCKVIVQHDNDEAQKELAHSLATVDAVHQGGGTFFDYDKESKRTTLYVLRDSAGAGTPSRAL